MSTNHPENTLHFPCGIPDITVYRTGLNSQEFLAMREFSDGFLALNNTQLRRYPHKWVPDPLHQWSRQWEYPYVFERIRRHAEDSTRTETYKILDAGSGVTFFPFFLADTLDNSNITCCDYDQSLETIYQDIVSEHRGRVCFIPADLHHLPFPDQSFDAIYCISVLEHTSDHIAVIAEFKRMLKSGGILCITFDIATNGDADIPPQQAQVLIADIYHSFPSDAPVDYSNLPTDVLGTDILTTSWIRSLDKSLLPWKHPTLVALKPLLQLRWPKSLFRNLTVFCHTSIKT